MKCNEFWEQYENTGLTSELKNHLDGCKNCQEEMLIEQALETSLNNLPNYEAPNRIWDNIIAEIPGNMKPEISTAEKIKEFLQNILAPDYTRSLKPLFAGVSIILLAAVSLMYFNTMPLTPERKQKLQAKAIEKIEKTERQYLESIARLSEFAEATKNNIDPEIYNAYQEKIALLDDYILECREAIDENEYNPQVRMYLAMAYKEKTDTLREMIKYTQQ